MHRLPERPRLDVRRLEREADVVARRAECCRVDSDAREPAVRPAVRRFRHERDAKATSEPLPVNIVNRATTLQFLCERLQLAPADCRKQVAEAVVVPDLGMLIMRRDIPCLRRQMT